MNQHQEVFKNSGGLKMRDLLYFNPTLTNEELKFDAQGIADFLDKAFVNTAGATYDECDRNKALEGMLKVLINGDKTMTDLAEQIDINYNF